MRELHPEPCPALSPSPRAAPPPSPGGASFRATIPARPAPVAASFSLPALRALLCAAGARVVALLACWRARSYQRRLLSELDGHMLRDMGISREQAGAEVRKPFWRA